MLIYVIYAALSCDGAAFVLHDIYYSLSESNDLRRAISALVFCFEDDEQRSGRDNLERGLDG